MKMLNKIKQSKRFVKGSVLLALMLSMSTPAQAFQVPFKDSVSSAVSYLKDTRLMSNYVSPAAEACYNKLSGAFGAAKKFAQQTFGKQSNDSKMPSEVNLEKLRPCVLASCEARVRRWFGSAIPFISEEFQEKDFPQGILPEERLDENSSERQAQLLEELQSINSQDSDKLLAPLLESLITASLDLITVVNEGHNFDIVNQQNDLANIYDIFCDEQERQNIFLKLFESKKTSKTPEELKGLYETLHEISGDDPEQAVYNVIRSLVTIPQSAGGIDLENYTDVLLPAIFKAACSAAPVLGYYGHVITAEDVTNIIKKTAQTEKLIELLDTETRRAKLEEVIKIIEYVKNCGLLKSYVTKTESLQDGEKAITSTED